MPIQISDLFALTSRQKNALRLKIVHLKCDEHFSHFWPIRFGRIPKWNFGRILVAHPIHLTLGGPMMTHQASQELIKSFGDKDSFMNGLLGCLLLGQVEVIPDHSPRSILECPGSCDDVTVIGFVFFPKISKSMLVFVWPRWFSYLISGLDLTIQIHLGSRLKSLAKQESSCRPLDSLWPKTSQS